MLSEICCFVEGRPQCWRDSVFFGLVRKDASAPDLLSKFMLEMNFNFMGLAFL